MKEKRSFKKNNSGMSLVELVVVVLILGVMASATFVGVDYMKKADAKNTAAMIKSAIERTRMLTISSPQSSVIELEVSKSSGGYCCTIKKTEGGTTTVVDEMTSDTNRVSVKFTSSSAGDKVITGSNKVSIKFVKSNGSMNCSYNSLVVSGAGKTSTVHLVTSTGRTYFD